MAGQHSRNKSKNHYDIKVIFPLYREIISNLFFIVTVMIVISLLMENF